MTKFKDLATESFVWAKQLSDLSGKPEKQLPTLLQVLHFLHREGSRATLPAILKDEIEALLGDPDVPPTFRLVSVNIARIALPESDALVGAIATDLDGSENPACVAAAAAGLAALPGKQLLEFMAKSTEGGTWNCKVKKRAWCGEGREGTTDGEAIWLSGCLANCLMHPSARAAVAVAITNTITTDHHHKSHFPWPYTECGGHFQTLFGARQRGASCSTNQVVRTRGHAVLLEIKLHQ